LKGKRSSGKGIKNKEKKKKKKKEKEEKKKKKHKKKKKKKKKKRKKKRQKKKKKKKEKKKKNKNVESGACERLERWGQKKRGQCSSQAQVWGAGGPKVEMKNIPTRVVTALGKVLGVKEIRKSI